MKKELVLLTLAFLLHSCGNKSQEAEPVIYEDNPIVEQVITETLRVVRDIWKKEGQIDEIHVDLGREMKNPADKRRQMTERILQNENTNLRIKAMLLEFMNPDMGIENVRPFSPNQQDILRIYEENALENLKREVEEYEFVTTMS